MRLLLVLSLLVLLIGCADVVSSTPTSIAPSPNTAQSASPAPQGASPAPQGAYPAPQGAYPAPQGAYPAPSNLPQGPEFTLNTPIKATDTQVSGAGPAGVPIKLLNMTDAGSTLAQATIGDDGTFKFDIGGKLTAGDRVGLVLGEVAGTKFDPKNFIRGPGYMDTPFIGIVFVSAEVE